MWSAVNPDGYSLLIHSCFTLNKLSLLLLQSMWVIISPLGISGPKPGNTHITSSIQSLAGFRWNLSLDCHWCPFWGEQTFVYIAPRKAHPTHTNLKVRFRRGKKKYQELQASSWDSTSQRLHFDHERGTLSRQVWLWHPLLPFSFWRDTCTSQPVL